MDLFVLDKNLDSIAVIDSYSSLIWTDRFQECGDFELVLPASSELFQCIKQDYYLWSKHSDRLMIIEKIEVNNDEEGDQVTVTGRSLESILDRRIVWGMKTLTGNFQNGIRTLLEENIISPSKPERKIDNFVFMASSDIIITEMSIETQYTGDNLYDVVVNQCKERGIGFKVIPNDAKQFVFQFYAGTDRSYDQFENPYVVFSPEFDNIVDSNYMESKSAMKNVTLVGGEGEGSERRYTAVGNTSGLDRRELFTDARDVSSDIDDDMTEAFNFSQYPSQAFHNTTKTFVSDPLFNSCMVNVSAYAGQTISITLPKYTGPDGQTSKYATILVDSKKKYISTLKAWERYDDSEDTVSKGNLETYEFRLPDDAMYLYTSMYTQKAIDDEVYIGELTDFECMAIKVSNDEYIRLLRQRGKEKLSENQNIVSFEGEAEATIMFRYGEHFTIGDIVQVADKYGHEVTSRVVEVIASVDDTGTTIYPTFSTISTEEEGPLLPEGYEELEYIKSTGTQWINTLFVPNNYTRIIMDIEATASGTYPFFGARDDQNENAFALWMISGTSIRFDYGTETKQASANPIGRVQIDVNANICTFGSTTVEMTSAKFQSSYHLALFTTVSGGVADERHISAKLYSCRIYDDGTLIRSFTPCRNPEGLVGLYDLINEKFYGNSGSGSFEAGQKGEETT